jgi:hypothetical protein
VPAEAISVQQIFRGEAPSHHGKQVRQVAFNPRPHPNDLHIGEHRNHACHVSQSEQDLRRRHWRAVAHAVGRAAWVKANDHVAALDLPDDHRSARILQRRRDEMRQRFGDEIRRRGREHRRCLAKHSGEFIAPCTGGIDDQRRLEDEIAIRGGPEAIACLFERDHARVRVDIGAARARRAGDRRRCKARVGRAIALRPGRTADIGPEIRISAADFIRAEKFDFQPARRPFLLVAL